MPLKHKLPWRQRKEKLEKNLITKTWWARLWASRSAWTLVGGAVAFILTQGVESLGNLRKLPSETVQTYRSFQSWYYDDIKWTGTWSSREEGSVEDLHQSKTPLMLTISTDRGRVFGEMFNKSVCELNPLLLPTMVEGEIHRGKLLANVFALVGGERKYLYSFQATRSSDEPVITLEPISDPSRLLPASARLVQRVREPIDAVSPNAEREPDHFDLVCPENPQDYIQRLLKEGKLKGVEELNETASSENRK